MTDFSFKMPEFDNHPLTSASQPSAPSSTSQPPFAQKFSHFMTRTQTQYAKAPLTLLSDRGIENRLLENLVEFLPDGAILAGGFLTNLLLEEDRFKDIDVFFTSEKAFEEMISFLQQTPEFHKGNGSWAFSGYTLKGDIDLDNLGETRFIVFEHPTRPALQLLRMVWYDSAEHVIDTFDLTIVQFAVDSTGLTYNPASFLDLSRKRIVLHRMQFPASTLRRLIKYADKGFYACPGSLANICKKIQEYKGETDVNQVVYVD